jgi:hypothetical protein
MNIKLKATLEIAGFVASALVIGVMMRLTLDYLSGIYGERQVVEAIVTLACVGLVAFMLKIMYDIRVAQLGYASKLKEMVKK